MFYTDGVGIQAAPVLFSLNKSRNAVTFGPSEYTYNNLFLTNCDQAIFKLLIYIKSSNFAK